MTHLSVFVPETATGEVDSLLAPAWSPAIKPSSERPWSSAQSPRGELEGVAGHLVGIWRTHLRWADISGLIERLEGAGCIVVADADIEGWILYGVEEE